MKKLGLILAAALSLAALTVAAPASAAVTCTYSSGTHQVAISAAGNNTFVEIVRSGTAIHVNGVACGVASVSNTALIKLTGGLGHQTATIDFSGGSFAPGFGADTGVAEIEFQVNLGGGTDDLTLTGSAAADNYRVGTAGINFNADVDSDIAYTGPGWEALTINGGLGGDTLSGAGGLGTGTTYPRGLYISAGDGANHVIGGLGNDYLYGGANNDVISGGFGNDYFYPYGGADQLNGEEDADTFYPGPGNDTLFGGAGADNFYADTTLDGSDVFNGGPGRDQAAYYNRASAVVITLDGVSNDGQPIEHDNLKPDVEDVVGSQAADKITGNASSNFLDGWNGNDTVNGEAGDDNIYGGYNDAGADTLHGGAGNDSVYGYAGNDKVYGDDGNDSPNGGAGNDLLQGGTGADNFYSDAPPDGSDNIYGGDGPDYASFYSRVNVQTLSLDNVANDGVAGENDNIHSDVETVDGGSAADTMTGSSGDNTLYGEGGADIIDGKAGADTLFGYAGNDQLTGGDGEDYLYGNDQDDSFKVQDGGHDVVYGGNGTDTVVNKDAFDTINEVP